MPAAPDLLNWAKNDRFAGFWIAPDLLNWAKNDLFVGSRIARGRNCPATFCSPPYCTTDSCLFMAGTSFASGPVCAPPPGRDRVWVDWGGPHLPIPPGGRCAGAAATGAGGPARPARRRTGESATACWSGRAAPWVGGGGEWTSSLGHDRRQGRGSGTADVGRQICTWRTSGGRVQDKPESLKGGGKVRL